MNNSVHKENISIVNDDAIIRSSLLQLNNKERKAHSEVYRSYIEYFNNSGAFMTNEGLSIGKDIGARSYSPLSKEEFEDKIKNNEEFKNTISKILK